jgi:hypothetical protein
MDSADSVFSSVEDRDRAREHPRRLNISDGQRRGCLRSKGDRLNCCATIIGMINQPAS